MPCCLYGNATSSVKILFHVQHQTLQVFSFRMIDVDRMVRRLMKLVQYAYVSSGNRCCREYSIAEVLFRHYL